MKETEKMKKLLAILLVICMMMSMLAACGSSETASTEAPAAAPAEEAAPAAPAEEPAAQEPVTLTILWGQSTTDAGVEDMIDEYMAANYPHITIEWECVDWGNDFQPKMNDVFNVNPAWGDDFRAGTTNFSTDALAQTAYTYNQLVYENTFADTFSLQQTDCDARMVLGEAAMKVSGSWSIQNFLDIDESFDFGIFPFPNQTGDSKLIFEPNITVMTNASSDKQDAINCFLDLITGQKDLAVAIYDYTKTASMLKDVSPTFTNPSQADIDKYAAEGRVVDVTLGNNQLVWGGFQEENAKDIAAWLLGDMSFEDCLAASDARVDTSSSG